MIEVVADKPNCQALDIMKDYKEAYRQEVRNRSKSPVFGHIRHESAVNQVAVGPSNQVVLTETSGRVYNK